MAKKYFNDYQLAHDFYSAQQGDCSIGQVRKDLVEDLGRWVVQYEIQATLEHNGKKLTVTHNGKKASRATQNRYQAVVVAEDASGKLQILSCHWDKAAAHKAVADFNAGKFVNFNYRDKRATAPVVIA